MTTAGSMPRRWLLAVALLGNSSSGCGLGLYDDSASPAVTSSATGVPDTGPWWPWVCPDGSVPSPATVPSSYTASGTCGEGGDIDIGVDGCLMEADWSVLGLGNVQTVTPTRTPNLGGWVLLATDTDGSVSLADGGAPPAEADGGAIAAWTCTALPPVDGLMTFTCTAGDATVCESLLTPAGGP